MQLICLCAVAPQVALTFGVAQPDRVGIRKRDSHKVVLLHVAQHQLRLYGAHLPEGLQFTPEATARPCTVFAELGTSHRSRCCIQRSNIAGLAALVLLKVSPLLLNRLHASPLSVSALVL